MRPRVLVPLLLLLSGCVYYNGMYNAKALAKRARHAERDGRTFEASNLWGQVSVKAETLLVQHPRSKYAEEARLLYGTARAKLNDCAGALPSLENVMLGARNPAFAEDAAEMVGWCRVRLGDAASASAVYARLTGSRSRARRDLALFAHGQALRMSGQYPEAIAELTQSHDRRAPGERAAALAGVGDLPAANLLIDSLIAAKDTAAPWVDITALVGARDVEAGTLLTERLIGWPLLSSTQRGHLLLDDAERLTQIDAARGLLRVAAVESLAPGTEWVARAQLLLLRRRLAAVESIDTLRDITGDMEDMKERAGPMASVIERLSSQGRKVMLAADSVTPGGALGDLRLFVAGEVARDSLGAGHLAAAQFRRIVNDWPASPFAPKALLALIDLQPVDVDTLQARMRMEYATSPYLIAVDGGETPELGVLEDSLRRFVQAFQPGRVPVPRPLPPQRRPPQPNRPATPTTEPQL